MNQAARIRADERIKARRSRYASVQPTIKSIGKALHTATPCSCWACGNPRKHFGEAALNERRFAQTEGWNA